MPRNTTMLNQKKFKEHDAWAIFHNEDQRAFLESLSIAELQQRAKKLGIKEEYISEYGHMQYKSTYISALRMAHVLSKKAASDKASETGLFDDDAFQKLEMDHSHLKKSMKSAEAKNEKLVNENIRLTNSLNELSKKLSAKEKEISQVKSVLKKRRREHDDALQDKQRTLFEIKQLYKRLKGVSNA